MRPKILVTAELDPETLSELREISEVEYASFKDAMRLLAGADLVEALRGVQVFVTEVDVVDAQALRELSDVRVIAVCRGDVVNVDVAACTAFGVPVLGTPGRNADAVADLTLAFLLMLARRLPEATGFLRQPGIEPGDMGRMGQAFTSLQGQELWRKTIGLIGAGAVGRAVARRLAGFGARVLAFDPHVSEEDLRAVGADSAELSDLLSQSDFVSLHAAVTEETRGLLGRAELARMKSGAFLVNTARAALVDEEALVDALRSGRLAGAALDVFAVEPPGSDHPLLALENVVATPHVGGNTAEIARHQGQIILDDLRALLAGGAPQHALNPEVLADFDWQRERPEPDAPTLETLLAGPGPSVTRERLPAPAQPAAAPSEAPAAAPPEEIVSRFRALLEGFTERFRADDGMRAFAAGKNVTLRFTLPDLGLRFFLRFRDGSIDAALDDPQGAPDVELKMRADVLDGMLTGRINAMNEALQGRLSFSGDTVKAMTLQQIQDELSRLYQEARAVVGDPGDLAALPFPGSAPAGAEPVTGEDVRNELVRVIEELFAAGLITATGGNASVRAPDAENELWITPSQFFKGDLHPEQLVRIDFDGRATDPAAPSPSSEWLMHCALYRARPEARAVIHAHAPYATILANAELPFLPISTEAAFFGDIPRVPFIMPGTEELAKVVGEAARASWAVLMQNHGVVVGGRSLRRAADMAEIIERSAQVMLGAYVLHKQPPTLPPDVVETLRALGDLMA